MVWRKLKCLGSKSVEARQAFKYSKTPIYRAQIYRVPRFTGLQIYPPKTSSECKSVLNEPQYTVLLDLPGLIPFPQEAW